MRVDRPGRRVIAFMGLLECCDAVEVQGSAFRVSSASLCYLFYLVFIL